MEPSREVDTKLLIQTHLFHPKIRFVISYNQIEKIAASTRDKTSVEPKTSPSENTQQNPLQIQVSSYSSMFTEQAQNPSLETPQKISEAFPLEQTQATIESLKLQHQKLIEAANQLLRKQQLERNQFLQHLNQPDTVVQDHKSTVKSFQLIPSTSKRVLSEQVPRYETSIPTLFIFDVMTDRKEEHLLEMLSALPKFLYTFQQHFSLPLKNCVIKLTQLL